MHRIADAAVVGLGEVSVDQRVVVATLPARGSKVQAREHTLAAGGQVATAMLAVQRLGSTARYVGAVGDDELAALALGELGAAGVALDVQVVAGARTRSAWILVDDAGERTIVELRDPRTRLEAARIDRGALDHARALHLDATDPTAALALARQARSARLRVSLDLDALDDESATLLPAVDLLVASETVLTALGSSDLPAALVTLARRAAPGATVCLTRGARGSLTRQPDGTLLAMPSFDVTAVDTTGCGDVFRGALLVALLEARPLAAALRFAAAAGALQATRAGAQAAVPRRREVDYLLATA